MLANFNSGVTLALLFQLTASVTVLCLLFLYPISLYKYFKRVDISALLPDKGQRIMVVVCIMTTLQHYSHKIIYLSF